MPEDEQLHQLATESSQGTENGEDRLLEEDLQRCEVLLTREEELRLLRRDLDTHTALTGFFNYLRNQDILRNSGDGRVSLGHSDQEIQRITNQFIDHLLRKYGYSSTEGERKVELMDKFTSLQGSIATKTEDSRTQRMQNKLRARVKGLDTALNQEDGFNADAAAIEIITALGGRSHKSRNELKGKIVLSRLEIIAQQPETQNVRQAFLEANVAEARANRYTVSQADDELRQRVVDAIYSNGDVASYLAIGPTGTGKTELLTRAISEAGFVPYIISAEKWLQITTLLGQQPIALDLAGDKRLLEGQRIQAIRGLVEKASPDQLGDLIANNPYLASITETFNSSYSTERGDQTNITQDIKEKLLNFLLVHEAASLTATETESGWREAGLTLCAINGWIPIIDEIDKTQNLDALLQVLATNSGGRLRLPNGSSVALPPWMHVFATSNSTALSLALKSRFKSLPVEYPQGSELMEKVLAWMSDDEGILDEKKYPPNEQVHLVTFLTKVVPELQSHAEWGDQHGKLKNFLDLRRIKKVVDRSAEVGVANAIVDVLLAPGELAELGNAEEQLLITTVLKKYNLLEVSQQYGSLSSTTDQSPYISRIINNPQPLRPSYELSRPIKFKLIDEMRAQLIKEAIAPNGELVDGEFLALSTGINVVVTDNQYSEPDRIEVTDSITGITIMRHDLGTKDGDLALLNADPLARTIVVAKGKDIFVASANGEDHPQQYEISDQANIIKTEVSTDGRFVVCQVNMFEQEEPILKIICPEKKSLTNIRFGAVKNWNIDKGANVVLVQQQDGTIYTIDLNRLSLKYPAKLPTNLVSEQFKQNFGTFPLGADAYIHQGVIVSSQNDLPAVYFS